MPLFVAIISFNPQKQSKAALLISSVMNLRKLKQSFGALLPSYSNIQILRLLFTLNDCTEV